MKNIRLNIIITMLLVIIVTGCTGIGPQTITRDRFDYINAISNSWKKQMLLNLVKTRYVDAPVFMEVSSVNHLQPSHGRKIYTEFDDTHSCCCLFVLDTG